MIEIENWNDGPISGCELWIQGFWLRLVLLMAETDNPGYLSQNGEPLDEDWIIRKCGFTRDEFEVGRNRMLQLGYLSVSTNSVFYSGSMALEYARKAREEEKENKPADPTRQLAFDVLAHLNQKAGRQFRAVDPTIKPIAARLKEVKGDVEGVKQMINRQCALWGPDPKMCEYLRPATLFGAGKFSQYYDDRNLPVKARSEVPLRTRIEAVKSSIARHQANPNYIEYNARCTQQQKDDLKSLKAKLTELEYEAATLA